MAYVQESNRLLRLSAIGFSQIIASPPLIEALARLDAGDEDISGEDQDRLARVRDDARYAKMEADNGFPRLIAHASVDLWAALEVLTEDLVITWLGNYQGALENDHLAKVRVPLVEYEDARDDKDTRMRIILRELERAADQKTSDQRLSVGCFEGLLDMVGLAGPVSDEVRKKLLELQQVRNVIVHRASIVDHRLSRLCPWLGVEPGTPLRLTREQYHQYSEAANEYALILINRIRVLAGIPPYAYAKHGSDELSKQQPD